MKLSIKFKNNTIIFLNRLFMGKLVVFSKSYLTSHNLQSLCIDYFLYCSKGVLHVGAYDGRQFAQHYNNFNKPVIWIEGNPKIFESLLNNITKYENQRAFNSLISSRNGVSNFFEVSNTGSSSIFPIKDSNVWGLRNVEKRTLPTVTLPTLFDKRELENYDLWVVDVQGAELDVLKGAEKLLVECCKYLIIEVSINSQYLGGCEYSDVKSFLINLGFVPAWDNSSFHADVMFINSRKLI